MKCSVHCHADEEHDCGYLASLALRTEVAIVENKEKEKEVEVEVEQEVRKSKRQRANTVGESN